MRRIIYWTLVALDRFFNSAIRIQGDPLTGVSVSLIYKGTQQSLDERLAKIDVARENLAEALRAMDEIRDQAKDNKHALEALNRELEGTSREKENAAKEIETLRSLAQLDIETVRRALGVPTARRRMGELSFSFILGIIASLAAAWIWRLIGG